MLESFFLFHVTFVYAMTCHIYLTNVNSVLRVF